MKILHLARQDTSGGGGGYQAPYRLHCHLRASGHDSVMLVLTKCSQDSTVIDFSRQRYVKYRIRDKLVRIKTLLKNRFIRPPAYFPAYKSVFYSTKNILEALPFIPDVIVAHWISGFVTTRNMYELSKETGAPVFWYCMDMAPITGGCHYPGPCTGYTKQCGRCPQLRSQREHDISFLQWSEKRKYVSEGAIIPVIPTTWLRKRAEESSLYRDRPMEQIMLALATDVFCPAPQQAARKSLGIPENRKIIFFGAHNMNEERKGVAYLVEALRHLSAGIRENDVLRKSILVVTAGRTKVPYDISSLFDYQHIGFLNTEKKLAAAYQAATVYVNSSVEDAGPLMINEAILCGTPVVSFGMGVALDLVLNGETGYRAHLRDSHDLAAGILSILTMDEAALRTMSRRCRELGVKKCHPAVQVKEFEEMFRRYTRQGERQ